MCTEILLVRRALGLAQPEDYVQWAIGMPADGVDTENLRILAGLSSRAEPEKIEHYFCLVRAELGLVHFDASQQPFLGTSLVRSAFDRQKASPAETIHWMAEVYLAGQPRELLLLPWSVLRDELEGLSSVADAVNLEWSLFDRARWVDLPEGWLHHAWCVDCGHLGELDPSARAPVDPLLRIPGRRAAPTSAGCPQCGSRQYRWLTDQKARSAYLERLEQEQKLEQ